jgi:protein involved in polysaccharide export with SLBB domain
MAGIGRVGAGANRVDVAPAVILAVGGLRRSRVASSVLPAFMPPRLTRLVVWLSMLTAPLGLAAAQSTPGIVAPGVVAPGAVMAGVAPGDRIMLKVWREPTWSDSLLVDAAGDIVLPRIGRFHAAGIVPVALRDTIERRLAQYLRDPSVDVVVLRRVAVLGAVRKPDVYYVDPTASLRDVLARAGGLTDDANPDRIEIVRDGVRTRVGRWNAAAERSAPVRSGDDVYVMRRSWLARNAVGAVSSVAVALSVILSAVK